jgi:outer membrane protein TolC
MAGTSRAGAHAAAATLVVLLLAACTAEQHARRADRRALSLLEPRQERTLGGREQAALRPDELAPEAPAPPAPAEPEAVPPEPSAELLDLRAALAIAFDSNRQIQTQREALRLQAISLSSVRHEFAPQVALTLDYLLDEVNDNPDRESAGASFSLAQLLPTGATLSLDASTAGTELEGADESYASLVTVRLAQPLLRGGGYDVTHESLVQGERDLVYAIRDFELFREDFSIDVARRFYDLVNQKQTIENQRQNLESNEFGRAQAEALFAVGRANELDVLRARRSELTARNDMLEAEESFLLALDRFKIFLGLPTSAAIDVGPDPPPFVPVSYAVDSAIQVALANRLDLLNQREQLEDVERGVRLSRNGLLPDLDLELGAAYATEPSADFGGDDFERSAASLAVSLGIPLDRVRERNAYRSAQIGLDQARRDLEEFEDDLVVSIKSSFRELERRLQSLDIQRQLIEDQTKNLRIAELRFERGEIPNRDVVEANQSLLDAQNALIDEQVNYEIARLQLLRDLGILFLDDTGMWK